ncbi:hypothetical protein Salmuc_01576 [Salipiger mucosus DSM 16094]|uniref:Uncharacterized protein n=1 Tax=Salipiger mucosus DSM 16094 TaxID=1123237 RepID=S9S9T3_9RHOB|nr:hypothetical protein Salmuc_01576 [Salipiger mucosus DSM 16094]
MRRASAVRHPHHAALIPGDACRPRNRGSCGPCNNSGAARARNCCSFPVTGV